MKFAEKCPKCNSKVQTKSIKRSFGLGFVDIPVAQFCLDPECDWYQDFAEAKKPQEIKQDVLQIKVPTIRNKLPELENPAQKIFKNLKISTLYRKIVAGFIAFIFIYILISFLISFPSQEPDRSLQPGSNNTNVYMSNISEVLEMDPTPSAKQQSLGQKKYSVKIDVTHGFFPDFININLSDMIIWNNEENQRPRLVLISKEDLFKDKLLEYTQKFSYQFNNSGVYNFVLAEYNPINHTIRVYPNAAGKVIVK